MRVALALLCGALLLGAMLWPRSPARVPPAADPVRGPETAALPVTPAHRAPASASLAEFESRLVDLYGCYEQRDCGYPRTDDRSYEFAAGQALRAELLRLAAAGLRGPEVSVLGARYLAVEDGHVQAAALALLATQAPSAAALEAVLTHVVGGYDAQLIPAALSELARYTAPGDRARVASALAGAMATGSPFVAHAISSRVAPFVRADVRALFASALPLLPEASLVREELARALR